MNGPSLFQHNQLEMLLFLFLLIADNTGYRTSIWEKVTKRLRDKSTLNRHDIDSLHFQKKMGQSMKRKM